METRYNQGLVNSLNFLLNKYPPHLISIPSLLLSTFATWLAKTKMKQQF